jgi:hypothetical protein
MTTEPYRVVHIVPKRPATGLGSVTWEQRRRMSAEELTRLMGALHVNHPEYKAKPRSLLPMPNIAGIQPVYECKDPTFWSLVKNAIHWVLK